jgi:predicted nucleic acid-binding protein
MIVYAESSAVLSWLLGETSGPFVLDTLDVAERVVSSSLTSVECATGLTRARVQGRLSAMQELAALQLLDQAESTWLIQSLSEHVLTRARAPMPSDSVRTLDALHVATAGVLRDTLGSVTVLSFDARLRLCATGLGFPLLP